MNILKVFMGNAKFHTRVNLLSLLIFFAFSHHLLADQHFEQLSLRISQTEWNELMLKMQRLEKAELHLHIGGAWPLDYLRKIAEPQQFSELSMMLAKIQKGRINYHDAFKVFGLIGNIVNNNERVQAGVEEICKSLLNDNVVYAELRTGLKDLETGLEGHLKAVLEGIRKGTVGTPLKVGLILSLRRETSYPLADQIVDLAIKYRNRGVVGIDLSGDSMLGNVKIILPLLSKAKQNGLPITLHIGESEEETAENQIMELQTIEPQRIGHGVHLCQEARRWIEENKVLFELCLTSALNTGMIKKLEDHPGLQLLQKGHPVAICTDDPLIFNTSLSQEYAKVAFLTELSVDEIDKLLKKIMNYRFLP